MQRNDRCGPSAHEKRELGAGEQEPIEGGEARDEECDGGPGAGEVGEKARGESGNPQRLRHQMHLHQIPNPNTKFSEEEKRREEKKQRNGVG